MSKAERGESVITTPVTRKISMVELCEKFKIPFDAKAEVVGANGSMPLAIDHVIVVEWSETTVQKPRKAREKKA